MGDLGSCALEMCSSIEAARTRVCIKGVRGSTEPENNGGFSKILRGELNLAATSVMSGGTLPHRLRKVSKIPAAHLLLVGYFARLFLRKECCTLDPPHRR